MIGVLDAHDTVAEQDASLLGLVAERGRALVDRGQQVGRHPRTSATRSAPASTCGSPFLRFAPVHFISALHGTGVGELDGAVQSRLPRRDARDADAGAHARAGAGDREAPAAAGARPAHQAALCAPGRAQPARRRDPRQPDPARARTPTGAISRTCSASVFRLEGTPMRVEFRTDENPFQGGATSSRRARCASASAWCAISRARAAEMRGVPRSHHNRRFWRQSLRACHSRGGQSMPVARGDKLDALALQNPGYEATVACRTSQRPLPLRWRTRRLRLRCWRGVSSLRRPAKGLSSVRNSIRIGVPLSRKRLRK